MVLAVRGVTSGSGRSEDRELRQVGERAPREGARRAVVLEVGRLVALDREPHEPHAVPGAGGDVHRVQLTPVVDGELALVGHLEGGAVGGRLDLVGTGRGAATVTTGGGRVDTEGADVDRLRQLDRQRLRDEHVGGRAVVVARGAAPAGAEAEVDGTARTTPEVGEVRAVEV